MSKDKTKLLMTSFVKGAIEKKKEADIKNK